MNSYTVIEKQNANSQREGTEFQARDLTAAKRKATSLQCFHGTYLELLDDRGDTIAAKEAGGKWIDQSYFS